MGCEPVNRVMPPGHGTTRKVVSRDVRARAYPWPRWLLAALPFASVVLGGLASAQNFVVDAGALPSGPGIDGTNPNVDFADIDLDGDWDAALARGGATGALAQSRLWVNQGGLQGAELGKFLDETQSRLPDENGSTHDVEFADIDGDGDLDLHLTNHCKYASHGSYWWVNVGLAQGGEVGYYIDETWQRWVGLDQPGSSFPPFLVYPGGAFFVDYAHDSDFADLDNDGDLDLVHSSYGSPHDEAGGVTPTRIFLNDGDGYFKEFNPSGFQLPFGVMMPGYPGLWCDGVHQENTLDVSGARCDIAARCFDVELGDLDGDYDLDLVLGDSAYWPRAFANRLDASGLAPAFGGSLGFRDVTALVLPDAPMFFTSFQLAQELGDLDHDGDLDLVLTSEVPLDPPYPPYDNVLLENDGGGMLVYPLFLASTASDEEVDCLDFDNDGDLDLYFAEGLSSPDRLYRNDGGFAFVQDILPPFAAAALDADACDVDRDGDYDVFVAEGAGAANTLLRNVTQVRDMHGPYLPKVEALGDSIATSGHHPVRVQVYDNAPYYVTWYNDTSLAATVDGVSLPPIEARSSGGQVFRAELPANLVGAVSYHFLSEDEYGNGGSSATVSFNGTTGLPFASKYGQATAGLLAGTPPTISALSVPFGLSTLYLSGHSDAPPGTAGFLVVAATKLAPPLAIPGLLLANVGPPLLLLKLVTTDSNGDAVVPIALPAVTPGIVFYAQYFALDSTAAGDLLSASKGLELVTQ